MKHALIISTVFAIALTFSLGARADEAAIDAWMGPLVGTQSLPGDPGCASFTITSQLFQAGVTAYFINFTQDTSSQIGSPSLLGGSNKQVSLLDPYHLETVTALNATTYSASWKDYGDFGGVYRENDIELVKDTAGKLIKVSINYNDIENNLQYKLECAQN